MVTLELFLVEEEGLETDGGMTHKAELGPKELLPGVQVEGGVVCLSTDEWSSVNGMAAREAAFSYMSLEIFDFSRDVICLIVEHERDEIVRCMYLVRALLTLRGYAQLRKG